MPLCLLSNFCLRNMRSFTVQNTCRYSPKNTCRYFKGKFVIVLLIKILCFTKKMKNHVYMCLAHHSLRPKSKIAQSSSVELFVCRVEVKVWLLRRRCGGTPSAPSPAPPPWTPSSPSQSSVVDTLCPSF